MCVYIETDCPAIPFHSRSFPFIPFYSPLISMCVCVCVYPCDTLSVAVCVRATCFGLLCEIVAVCNLLQMTPSWWCDSSFCLDILVLLPLFILSPSTSSRSLCPSAKTTMAAILRIRHVVRLPFSRCVCVRMVRINHPKGKWSGKGRSTSNCLPWLRPRHCPLPPPPPVRRLSLARIGKIVKRKCVGVEGGGGCGE